MNKKNKLKQLHIIIIILGIAFILLSIFHKNVWVDEAYSIGMANKNMVKIWKIGAHDVHPVLYYWMLRIINILTNNSVYMYRIFSALPIILLGILGITHIKKDFGEKVGLLFSFFSFFLPVMIVYTNQIRMYSWAIYIVTVFYIYAYRIYLGQTTKINWIIYLTTSLASIYIHYYGLITVGLVNVFLLIHFIKNRRWKELRVQLILGILQIIVYLPWVICLFGQMKHVSKGFWIQYEKNKLINLIGFQMAGNMSLWVGFIANILLFTLLGIIIFRKTDKENSWKPVIYSMAIYISIIIVALVITKILNTVVLYHRYLFVVTGLYIFGVSYILSKEDNKYIVLLVCLIILILSVSNNIIQIKENYDKSNGKQIKYLKENIQKEDVIVYKNIDIGSIFACNFINNKQFLYNPEDWGVVEAYKVWEPQMEVYINTNFLEQSLDRIWVIDCEDNNLYNELFDNKYYEYISTSKFETKYKKYVYNITLVKTVKK